MGSFFYGDLALRIKLRKNVRFVFSNLEKTLPLDSRDCEYYKKKYPKDFSKLVIAHVFTAKHGMSEYVLCSEGAVHSWSYGTPEQLVESQLEKDWIVTHKGSPDAYDSYQKNTGIYTKKAV